MLQEGKPSPFCPDFCPSVKANEFSCRKYTNCWHIKDKKLSPKPLELTIRGVNHKVTIIGENNVFAPIWYLKDGSLPQMLPKNYEIFSKLPEFRKEKTQKEKYDEMKAKSKRKLSVRQ